MTARAAGTWSAPAFGRGDRPALRALARESVLDGTAGEHKDVRLADVPIPAAIVVVGILLPQELDFTIAGAQFSLLRLALMVLLPMAMVRLFLHGLPAVRLPDVLMLLTSAWYWLALIVKGESPVTGGTVFLEFCGGYFVARVFVRDARQFIATVRLLFICVLVSIPLAFLEATLHQHLARNLLGSAVGLPPLDLEESRLGMLRAKFVFEHPIAYGAWAAGAFALVWWTEARTLSRMVKCGLVILAVFWALSSAPLIGIGLAVLAALWERSTRGIPGRVAITLGMLGAAYLFVSLVATRPISQILTAGLVYDPWNAYYRTLIWEFGIENVLANPLWGVSLITWERASWMPPTVDNYWLAKTMSGGVPCLVAYLSAIAFIVLAVGTNPAIVSSAERRRCRNGWLTTMLVMAFIGATSHFWRVNEIYFCFILGLGCWMIDAPAEREASRPGADERRSPPRRLGLQTNADRGHVGSLVSARGLREAHGRDAVLLPSAPRPAKGAA